MPRRRRRVVALLFPARARRPRHRAALVRGPGAQPSRRGRRRATPLDAAAADGVHHRPRVRANGGADAGDPAQQLPARISNPDPAPIEVTGLTASVIPDQPACAADPNFEVTPAGVTPQEPLSIPTYGSATLPSPSAAAPTLALRDLPVDQNACRGTSLRIVFSGEARGCGAPGLSGFAGCLAAVGTSPWPRAPSPTSPPTAPAAPPPQ